MRFWFWVDYSSCKPDVNEGFLRRFEMSLFDYVTFGIGDYERFSSRYLLVFFI